MIRGILIAILTIGIVGTAYWGYKEHQEKNAVLIHAENNYQRAFHDLTYQVDQLNDKIGATLAMNSKKSLSPGLVDVWRITSEAQSDVGQLPLTLLPFNKTEEFLASIADFSYRTAVRDLDKEPLSDKEYATLKQLYTKSEDIQKELRNVQHLVIDNNLRWMDVELALAAGEKQMDNTIINGFKTVEKNVNAYSETDFDPSFTSVKKSEEGFNHLQGKTVTEKEVPQIIKKFVPSAAGNMKITPSGKGSRLEFYSVEVNDPKHKSNVFLDITKKGGYPIWLIQEREVKDQKISLNDASNNAAKFLKDQGFEDLVLYESAQFENIGIFSFVSVYENVRLYPDAIRMKVALDDGKVIGFSARDYLASHRKREIPNAGLTLAEAKGFVNPNLLVQEDRLAIITNELGEEILCYEFLGTMENDTYRIFVNADDGSEEKVEKLDNSEPIYQEI
ncbi:germination protein YpeB [Bacillus sp. UMB0893]|uniref:germination protein YpeB n=1 Tax=Bacillus sp. UMB0893 TaxID=2066053 RepID=UPI000C76B372|nr:germination protein YpeB [Bacillus sp. UMB0893]PLR66740.1 germination protein YpeB [Bacillus sp. UMB0893]